MRTPRRVSACCLLLALWCHSSLASTAPVILASIGPVSWLVAALAPADAHIEVLYPPGQSPHDYRLRPVDMVRLRQSDLLVWIGPGMESALAPAAAALPPGRALALLPAASDPHHEGAAAEALTDASHDPHLWLDPQAMGEAATRVAGQLKARWPADTAAIDARLQAFQAATQEADTAVAKRLAPVHTSGFIAYHDAYQRLVSRYQLNQRDAVWRHEGIPGGARDRARLLQLLGEGDTRCLFYEPEHGREAVQDWLGNAAGRVRLVELDLLGSAVPTAAGSYPIFIEGLADRMAGCLGEPMEKPGSGK